MWPKKRLVCVTCDPFLVHTRVCSCENTHTHTQPESVYFQVCACVCLAHEPDVDMCLGIQNKSMCICAFTCVIKRGFTGSLYSSSGFIASGQF